MRIKMMIDWDKELYKIHFTRDIRWTMEPSLEPMAANMKDEIARAKLQIKHHLWLFNRNQNRHPNQEE